MKKQRGALVGAMVALFSLGLGGASSAAGNTTDGVRSDSTKDPVYFVPGYDRESTPGIDCNTYWKDLPEKMKEWGWSGTSFHKVGYYAADANCDTRIARGGHETSIRTLGRELAQHIYANYTSKGQSVDLVGHSMGGLVARAALSGVQRKLDGFPEKLLVNDAVTFDTGHKGVEFASLCGTVQCRDMRNNSHFLTKWALDNPQGQGGTDWTLLSVSEVLDRVTRKSALGMNSPHFVHYEFSLSLNHGNLPNVTTGEYPLEYKNSPAGWVRDEGGQAPGRVAANALYSNRW